MKCQEVRRLAVAYLDGEVTHSERSLILAHVARCDACRTEMDELQVLKSCLGRSLKYSAAQVSASPQSLQKLQDQLAKQATPGAGLRQFGWSNHSGIENRGGNAMRKFAFAAFFVFLFALGMIAFTPSARAQAIEVIKRIILGENMEAVQIPPQPTGSARPIPSDMWIVRTEIGNFGGNTPPGVEPVVSSYISLEEAQTHVGFGLLSPTELPAGYALREVKIAPIGGSAWVFLFYAGPGHDIVIAQMPTGEQPGEKANQVGEIDHTERFVHAIEITGNLVSDC